MLVVLVLCAVSVHLAYHGWVLFWFVQTGGIDKKYASLEDGRRLCLECLETAVLDTNQCQPLYRDILKFYKNLGMMIDQEIPMLLVARSALNAAREGEKEVFKLLVFTTKLPGFVELSWMYSKSCEKFWSQISKLQHPGVIKLQNEFRFVTNII